MVNIDEFIIVLRADDNEALEAIRNMNAAISTTIQSIGDIDRVFVDMRDDLGEDIDIDVNIKPKVEDDVLEPAVPIEVLFNNDDSDPQKIDVEFDDKTISETLSIEPSIPTAEDQPELDDVQGNQELYAIPAQSIEDASPDQEENRFSESFKEFESEETISNTVDQEFTPTRQLSPPTQTGNLTQANENIFNVDPISNPDISISELDDSQISVDREENIDGSNLNFEDSAINDVDVDASSDIMNNMIRNENFNNTDKYDDQIDDSIKFEPIIDLPDTVFEDTQGIQQEETGIGDDIIVEGLELPEIELNVNDREIPPSDTDLPDSIISADEDNENRLSVPVNELELDAKPDDFDIDYPENDLAISNVEALPTPQEIVNEGDQIQRNRFDNQNEIRIDPDENIYENENIFNQETNQNVNGINNIDDGDTKSEDEKYIEHIQSVISDLAVMDFAISRPITTVSIDDIEIMVSRTLREY